MNDTWGNSVLFESLMRAGKRDGESQVAFPSLAIVDSSFLRYIMPKHGTWQLL
jgi:hypothetical protein